MSKYAAVAAVWLALSFTGPSPQAAELPRGVWRDSQHGYLLDTGRRSSHMYDVVDDRCIRHARLGNDHLVDQLGGPPQAAPDALVFASGPSRYDFQRLPALPPACRHKASARPDAVYDLMVATLRTHHADAAGLARLEAIDARQRALAAEADTDAALFAVLVETLSPLQDAHVTLSDGDDREFEAAPPTIGGVPRADAPTWKTQRWDLKGFLEGAHSPLAAPPVAAGNRRLLVGALPSNTAYLAVLSMAGYSDRLDSDAAATAHGDAAAAVFDEVLETMTGSPGLIIDLRYNEGGHDTVALALAQRLATERVRAFGKRTRGPGGMGDSHYTDLVPTGAGFAGPIAVLIGPYTISAGEVGALALAALPNVVLVGEPTFGAWSDALPKALPNGWSFTVAPDTYLDARGNPLHGGLAPDFSADTPVLGTLRQRYAPAIVAAADLLAQH